MKRVIDGDTFSTVDNTTYRLYGIDTEEHGQYCYGEAKDRLRQYLMSNTTIRIDTLGQGIYGRELALIYVDGDNINEELLSNGLAVSYFPDKNTQYHDRFRDIEQKVIEKNIGCKWNNSYYTDRDIEPCEASDYIGEKIKLKGVVKGVTRNEDMVYLNFGGKYPDNCFSAVIWQDDISRFDDLEKYENKTVSLYGLCKEYDNKSEIVLYDDSQLNIL